MLQDSLFEKSTFFAQTERKHSKTYCQYFNRKVYVQKHFQDVQGLLESWRFVLEDYSIKYGKLHCREKTDSEFSADAGCICDKAAMIRVKDEWNAVLMRMINYSTKDYKSSCYKCAHFMQKFISSSGMSSTDAMASVDCTLKKA